MPIVNNSQASAFGVNAPPAAVRGTLAAVTGTVAYTDTTAKTLFTLPAKAVPVQWIVNVVTAFNDSGTDLLNVGKTGTDNAFAAALNVASTGQLVTGFVVTALNVELPSPTTVVAKYTGENGDSSAGSAQVTCIYRY